MTYYAHSANKLGLRQTMKEHLTNVATMASRFAESFGGADEAYLAGILHDLGKYSERFSRRLEGKEKGLDHWTAGAWVALTKGKSVGAALAIQGHHIGLQRGDIDSLRELDPLASIQRSIELSETDVEALTARLQADGFTVQPPKNYLVKPKLATTASVMLDVRMLFSALVDADFLDTAQHFGEERETPKSLEPARALAALERYLDEEVRQNRRAKAEVIAVREELLHNCRETAANSPGLFTLTAPTGSGKTLGMLLFGLTHAQQHDFKRLILVFPYLTIVEQVVSICRAIFEPVFGSGYVLEHHSSARWQRLSSESSLSEEERRFERQLSENWQAPLIITTNVQFLESLFSNSPGDCRKLHSIGESIVFFDEVQTLPTSIVLPTLRTLSRLASPPYRVSIVFSTATQPAFSLLHKEVQEEGNSGWKPREIAPPHLFKKMQRVTVDWRLWDVPMTIEELCRKVAQEPMEQLLCVVNMRKDARAIALTLRDMGMEGLYHLSTCMCPLHRQEILKEVKARLLENKACRLISTQCVEAGVDVDFPLGYRVLGPLSAIAQVAGRVNRNGLLEGKGTLRVFRLCDERYPDKAYEQATRVTEKILRELGTDQLDIESPALYQRYYGELYNLAGINQLNRDLLKAIANQNYREVAQGYRIIDEDFIHVVVPYQGALELFEQLADEVRSKGVSKSWVRRAQPLTISLYLPRTLSRSLEPVPGWGFFANRWFLCYRREDYDSLVGFYPKNDDAEMDVLIA